MHDIRWTIEKIEKRIDIIKELVYTEKVLLPPFKYFEYHQAVPKAPDIINDDSSWEIIEFGTYWGKWKTNFILQTRFLISGESPGDCETALYLPLGEAGDFSYPEGLIYIDGTPIASCDRHHQEILFPGEYIDSREHILTIYGWTGLGGFPTEDECQTADAGMLKLQLQDMLIWM